MSVHLNIRKEQNMENKLYKYHITGLKGIACMLIMFGHYLGLYKFAEHFSPRFPLLDAIWGSPYCFILDGGYWLYLFFVVSGYLIARSNVKSFGDIVHKSISRFLRLAFPILFAYIIIYLTYVLIGFHNTDTYSLFQCDWYQSYYLDSYSMKDVLCGPIDVLFHGRSDLNAPYWVLKDMFIASIMVYMLKYFFVLFGKNETICFSVLNIITFVSFFVSPIITACLMGMLVSFYEGIEEVYKKPYFAFWAMVVAMALYILPRELVAALFFASLIIFIPRVKFIDHILASRVFQFLGKISWGVYSFHWPLICSFGAILIINLQSKVGLAFSYIIVGILISVLTLIVSVMFYYTFERLSTNLSAKIDVYLRRLIYFNRR